MAKRPLAEIDPVIKESIERVGDKLVGRMDQELFLVEGAPNVIVKYVDGTFKRKVIFGGWEFFLEYVYVGKSGKTIFGMTPEDAQEYSHVEVTAEALDEAFPMAGSMVAAAYGLQAENFRSVFDALVMADAEEQLKAIEAVKALEKDEISAYAGVPNFGRF